MKPWIKAITGCWMVLSAAAHGYQKPLSPIEKSIRSDADLSHLDADLNRLYGALRPQVTEKARAELLAQQRAWLAKRNHDCATGEVACLRQQYRVRIDQLEALNATAQAGDGKLDNVTPVVVKGQWKATAVQDPAGKGQTDATALRQSLADAELPGLDAIVNTVPGKLCLPAQPCGPMGWTRKTLAEVNGSRAIGRYLELDRTTPVLVGSSGTTQSYYLLVPRSGGTLWAVFTLCGADASDCRKAAEVWTPASADSAISPH